MKIHWLLFVTLFCIAGCQIIPDARPAVPYGDGNMRLQHSWPYADLHLLQHAVFESEKEHREFLLSTYIQQEQLLVIALALTGQELFRVTLIDDFIQVSGQNRLPDPRLPLRLVAEMQLALLPADILSERLTKLSIEDNLGSGWKRIIYQDNQDPVLSIQSDASPLEADMIHITHPYYDIQITTLERNVMEAGND